MTGARFLGRDGQKSGPVSGSGQALDLSPPIRTATKAKTPKASPIRNQIDASLPRPEAAAAVRMANKIQTAPETIIQPDITIHPFAHPTASCEDMGSVRVMSRHAGLGLSSQTFDDTARGRRRPLQCAPHILPWNPRRRDRCVAGVCVQP